METCDNCPEKWACYEPCLEVIAWKELEAKDRMKPNSYNPKGVAIYTKSGAQYRKEKARLGGKR